MVYCLEHHLFTCNLHRWSPSSCCLWTQANSSSVLLKLSVTTLCTSERQTNKCTVYSPKCILYNTFYQWCPSDCKPCFCSKMLLRRASSPLHIAADRSSSSINYIFISKDCNLLRLWSVLWQTGLTQLFPESKNVCKLISNQANNNETICCFVFVH